MNMLVWPFVVAGCVGVLVAIFHGIVTQKKMVTPILRECALPPSTQRLVPLLLHFSTICWLCGGVALILGPLYLGTREMATTAIFVATFYFVGAVGNFWGTKGKHPGWILLAIATATTIYGIIPLLY